MRMKLSHFLIATVALSLAACGQQSLPDNTVKDAGLGDAFFTSLEAGQRGMDFPANTFDYVGGETNHVDNPTLYNVSTWDDNTVTPRTGIFSLRFTADDKSNQNTGSAVYFKAFDVDIPVMSGTFLEYWVYPRQEQGSCVSVDLIFTDRSILRNLGAKDQNGNSMRPVLQCKTMQTNQWNFRKTYIGTVASGKTIDRIMISNQNFIITPSYNRTAGGIQTNFDDIRIGTDNPPRVIEAESSGWHGIGHAESDGWSADPSTDSTGHLIYGPYVTDLRPGPNTAKFTMLIGDTTGPAYNVATIGVWNVTKNRMEGSRTVYRNEWNAANTYQDFQFDFQNYTPGDELSFLLYWYGGVTYLKLDKITVY
jgi:hypothetical protein